MKSSDELNKKGTKIKTTKSWVKIIKTQNEENDIFLVSVKWLDSMRKHMLKTVFMT